jgi:molecular chaperone GrpE (heat shock protein)
MCEEVQLPQDDDNSDSIFPNDCENPDNPQDGHVADESVIDSQADDTAGLRGPSASQVRRLDTRLRRLTRAYLNQTNRLESYLQVVTACQKQTAEFANHVIERHALHPAVETVDLLTGLIGQLNDQANGLVDAVAHCPMFEPLFGSIAEAARMAHAKREHLDMRSICPAPLDDLDIDKHEIRQVIPTDNADKHKRVERTLISGLIYRGAVLRRAKVSIYRHTKQKPQD